ncbi:hypothetical protein AW736_21270 [Termitidicoccus mucosus]|uniref:Uncharacterized protein n=1 Tax=Termitidicoccus mucosus TaxID=1184151 RepID=A0A178IDI5_9BACT|nr:hypothetical protein AW736_21270 [Opitutaceae bacterium TSB47]
MFAVRLGVECPKIACADRNPTPAAAAHVVNVLRKACQCTTRPSVSLRAMPARLKSACNASSDGNRGKSSASRSGNASHSRNASTRSACNGTTRVLPPLPVTRTVPRSKSSAARFNVRVSFLRKPVYARN